MSRATREQREEQARKARDEAKGEVEREGVEPKYTVVVEMSHPTAQQPGVPTMAYVIPSGRLSPTTIDSFRKAAELGGCQVRMFTVGDSGVEAVKWELMNYGATKLM